MGGEVCEAVSTHFHIIIPTRHKSQHSIRVSLSVAVHYGILLILIFGVKIISFVEALGLNIKFERGFDI